MGPDRVTLLALIGALVITASSGVPARAEHSGGALLPDLGMAPLRDFKLERKPKGVRWLRFTTVIVNVGTGALDVYGRDGGAAVVQRIEDPSVDGGWAEHAIPATMFYAGDGHDHWHVRGLQLFELTHAQTYEKTEVLSTGAKTGFCFWDNEQYLDSAGPAYYHPSTTDACDERYLADGSFIVPMGLSVGWGDRYSWSTAYQYIDITGLPFGDYWVTATADPSNEFVESNDGNNFTQAKIRITSRGVTVLEAGSGP